MCPTMTLTELDAELVEPVPDPEVAPDRLLRSRPEDPLAAESRSHPSPTSCRRCPRPVDRR